jgi:CheY-like chemotaxis protein
MGGAHSTLAGLRILVVEDEVLIAMLIEEMLQELGCEVVGPVATIEAAVDLVERNSLDGALLDSNLNGKSVIAVIEALAARTVPFVMLTGYERGDLRGFPLMNISIVNKPIEIGRLADEMATSFAARSL